MGAAQWFGNNFVDDSKLKQILAVILSDEAAS